MKRNLTKLSSSSGNVIIEFTLAAVALFIPISYVSVAATQIATEYLEVQHAAQAGARLFATSEVESTGRARSTDLIHSMLGSSNNLNVSLSCTNKPCLVKDGIVQVRIDKQINLDLPAPFRFSSITITGIQAEIVQDSQ